MLNRHWHHHHHHIELLSLYWILKLTWVSWAWKWHWHGFWKWTYIGMEMNMEMDTGNGKSCLLHPFLVFDKLCECFFFFNKIIWGGVSWRLHWYGLWTMDMETWKWIWRMEKACLHPSSVFVNVFSIRWYEEGREGREDTCLAPVMRPPWVIHTPSTTLCDIQTNTVQYSNKYGAIFEEILWDIQRNAGKYWKKYCGRLIKMLYNI